MAALGVLACTDAPSPTAPPEIAPAAALFAHDSGSFGNNLSAPVIFADGLGTTGANLSRFTGLRPLESEGIIAPNGAFFWDGNVPDFQGTHFAQQTANTWRAEWSDGSALPRIDVRADWSDNLLRHTYPMQATAHIEHTLYADQQAPLMGFNMTVLSGQGPTEIQGTDGTTALMTPTVFTVTPRLVIQKLDSATRRPVFTVVDVTVEDALRQHGPGGYRVEVNMSGKTAYTYNFSPSNAGLPSEIPAYGWYRITMLFQRVVEGQRGRLANKVFIRALSDSTTATDSLWYTPKLAPELNAT